jgi:hypothetical protein
MTHDPRGESLMHASMAHQLSLVPKSSFGIQDDTAFTGSAVWWRASKKVWVLNR